MWNDLKTVLDKISNIVHWVNSMYWYSNIVHWVNSMYWYCTVSWYFRYPKGGQLFDHYLKNTALFGPEFLYTYFQQFYVSVSQEIMPDEAGRRLISLFQNQLIYSIKFYNIDILTSWLPGKA
jgi:hypothetical protein